MQRRILHILLITLLPMLGRGQVTTDTSLAIVQRLPFNSLQSDFGGVPYGNGMLYGSERYNSRAGVKFSSSITQTALSDLYYIERKGTDKWKRDPKPFSNTINSRLHEGPAWISSDSMVIYFTRSNLNPGEGTPIESIWSSKRVNGKWEIPTPAFSDISDQTVSHPWVDTENNRLYFSADLPGGYGGMDLYVVPLSNLSLKNVRNLGPVVNGPGNEVFPTISSEGHLVFASTSHPGLGGLDLYILRDEADLTNGKVTRYIGTREIRNQNSENLNNNGRNRNSDNLSGNSQYLEHFPAPINGPKDDFAFYLEDSTLTGWFTSNRKYGGRDDDIYSVTLFEEPTPPIPPFADCIPVRQFDYCYTFFDEITGSDLPYGLYYAWDFGDGDSEKGIRVRHCYANTGTYQIRLVVTDSLTGEPVFNQAGFELEVEYPYPLFIEGPEMLTSADNLFSATNGRPEETQIESYHWSIGNGWKEGSNTITLPAPEDDSLLVSLGIRGIDQLGNPVQECVERTFYQEGKGPIALNPDGTPVLNPDGTPKLDPDGSTGLEPTDNENIRYRIQLGSSLKPMPKESPLYKRVPGVEERYSDGVYRYLTPEELTLDSAFTLLPRYRSLGFKHPSVIKDKVGEKYFRKNWLPGDLANEITVTGTVKDKNNIPIEGTIIWENLRTGEVLMETAIRDSGHYQESLPKEAFYGYYIDLEGYYTVSHHLDLTNYAGDIVIDQDLELISIDDMIRYQLPVKINNLFFDFDKSTIKQESFAELNRLVRFIQDHPELKFNIAGHTDNIGEQAYNLELSRLRAGEVGRFLVLSGCHPDQLEIQGAGENEPIANNATPAGRQENRRVEFRIEKLSKQ